MTGNMIKDRIQELRRLMAEWGWDAAVTVGSDPHDSEYTPLRWCQRQFISGFTGSAGTVIVTGNHAGLWTDSRYWIQASRELEGSGIELHKTVSVEDRDWMEWIAANVRDGGTIGVDGLCMSMGDAGELQRLTGHRGVRVVSKPDYLEALWPDRPGLPDDTVWLHEDCYSGRSRDCKLADLRKKLESMGCSYMLVSCLDEIAWLLNIRSGDVLYCPFVISFAVVGPSRVWLFAKESKFPEDVLEVLAESGIELLPYSGVSGFIRSMKADGKILINPSSLNFETGQAVESVFGADGTVAAASPISVMKAVKNGTEIKGFRKAYIQDGVAQTRFFHWLESTIASGRRITEWDASEKLHELRAAMPDFLDESFETISAYGANAALPHYTTVKGEDAVLNPRGLYLNDSGAHYSYGTTDITRTVPLGPLTDLEREDYTICLKAMIDLAMAVFPEGTPGGRLDAVARRPLWQTRRNFGHGTGHGVGNLLSVHEGPQAIRQNLNAQPLLPGMVTSDEPGIYREGFHGVRHENMILCVKDSENDFGNWLSFETLTRTYIDTSAVIPSLMDAAELEWLNCFNASVAEEICPLLDAGDAEWLKEKTRPI